MPAPGSDRSTEAMRSVACQIRSLQQAILRRDSQAIELHTAAMTAALSELRPLLQTQSRTSLPEIFQLRNQIQLCSAVIRRVRGTVRALLGFHRTIAAETQGIMEAGR